MGTQPPKDKRSKRKWLVVFIFGIAVLVAFQIWSRDSARLPQASRIGVRFVSSANDSTGRRVAMFSITNGNEQKLYFNAFIHGSITNSVGSDYLSARSDYIISVPIPAPKSRWRLAVSCTEADESLVARAHGLWQRLVHRQIYYYSKPGAPFTVFSAENE